MSASRDAEQQHPRRAGAPGACVLSPVSGCFFRAAVPWLLPPPGRSSIQVNHTHCTTQETTRGHRQSPLSCAGSSSADRSRKSRERTTHTRHDSRSLSLLPPSRGAYPAATSLVALRALITHARQPQPLASSSPRSRTPNSSGTTSSTRSGRRREPFVRLAAPPAPRSGALTRGPPAWRGPRCRLRRRRRSRARRASTFPSAASAPAAPPSARRPPHRRPSQATDRRASRPPP